MDPYEFEELVAKIWELQGYETTVRKGSGDKGIDIEATKQMPICEKVLIQAKRYAEGNKIGSGQVRKYATLYQQVPDADTVVLVTTGEFTSQAEELALDLDVKAIDGEDFAELYNESHIERDRIEFQADYKKGDVSDDNHDLNHPFTSTEIPSGSTPTPSQNLFNTCPECDEKGSIWFSKGQSTTLLKCENCKSGWKKFGSSNGTNWKEYTGPNEGRVKNLASWNGKENDSSASNADRTGAADEDEKAEFREIITGSADMDEAELREMITGVDDEDEEAALHELILGGIVIILISGYINSELGVLVLIIVSAVVIVEALKRLRSYLA